MTDRIRELMNQVGIGRPVGAGDGDTYVVQPVTPAQLRKFAALVRRDALEEAAKICDTTPPYPFRASIEAAHTIRALAAQEES